MMKTRIIYEDDHMMVCYKPAGLATQTARVGQQDMVSELKNYLAAKQHSRSPYLGVIHRLDQPVEGLLVFAKNSKAAAALTAQLSGGTLNKRYYAVVCGRPVQKSGELVDYLAKDPVSGSAVVVTPDDLQGSEAPQKPEARQKSEALQKSEARKAVLQYSIIGELSTPRPVTLLDIHIDTGRFHQIRVQMAHAGLPLLGDSRYGSQESKQLSGTLGVRNVALCACCIAFKHPVTGKFMEFREVPQGQIFSGFQLPLCSC